MNNTFSKAMAKSQNQIVLPLALLGVLLTGLHILPSKAGTNETGEKGAQVYCYMRRTGNSHAVSWKAAYEVIKRQKSSLFKTSPKHAAVMIVESVVENPNTYERCGNYLGDLFGDPNNKMTLEEITSEEDGETSGRKKGERYSY